MPRETSVVWGSPLACGTQLSPQWSGACLSYTWEAGYSTLLGLLIDVLAPLLASGDFAREPICGWARSADVAADTWADMSPCRRVCSDLGSLPLEPKCHRCLAAVLVVRSDTTSFRVLYPVVSEPAPFYWPRPPHTGPFVACALMLFLCDRCTKP